MVCLPSVCFLVFWNSVLLRLIYIHGLSMFTFAFPYPCRYSLQSSAILILVPSLVNHVYDPFVLYLTDEHICMLSVFLRTIYQWQFICLINHVLIYYWYFSDDCMCMLTRPWLFKCIRFHDNLVYYDKFSNVVELILFCSSMLH